MTLTLSEYAGKGRDVIALIPGYYHPRVLPEVRLTGHLAKQDDTHPAGRLRILRAMRFAFRRALMNGLTSDATLDMLDSKLERIDQIFLPEIDELAFALAASIGKRPSEVPPHVLEAMR